MVPWRMVVEGLAMASDNLEVFVLLLARYYECIPRSCQI